MIEQMPKAVALWEDFIGGRKPHVRFDEGGQAE